MTDVTKFQFVFGDVYSSFHLQVTVHVKGKTECYECNPKPTPKTYPVCTITSTPSKVLSCG